MSCRDSTKQEIHDESRTVSWHRAGHRDNVWLSDAGGVVRAIVCQTSRCPTTHGGANDATRACVEEPQSSVAKSSNNPVLQGVMTLSKALRASV